MNRDRINKQQNSFRKFSVIIPVYNRPSEIDELLQSLTIQSFKDFEVVVVEDGSSIRCNEIVEKYRQVLDIKYFYKMNEGRSIARNYGIQKAQGNFYFIFDSDCILPKEYFFVVREYFNKYPVEYFGGPDSAHNTFTIIQRAISYSMTSFFTTGGLRGSRHSKFYPRSFNMGISETVMKSTGGFLDIPLAEDLDLSMRVEELGFKLTYIEDAFVYHKRRTSLMKFFRQVNRFGIGRIDLYLRHPHSLKLMHFAPTLFILFTVSSIILSFFKGIYLLPLTSFIILVFLDSLRINKNLPVAIASVAATFIQMFGYGSGFLLAFFRRVVLKQREFGSY